MAAVTADQFALPKLRDEWSVQELIDHMVGSTGYVLAALDGTVPAPARGATAADFEGGRRAVLDRLSVPGVLEGTGASPLGFEWTIGQAVAGTFMDSLIHTWDLATATGQDATLDPVLVQACIAMFLPAVPEQGRAAGLVGPAIAVAPDAPPQARLLAAMGRRP